MRICSRTRDWPACVAPAKNFICVYIVLYNLYSMINSCGIRNAVRGVTPLRIILMRERAHNFSAHLDSDGAHAPYCTNDCLYRHATRRKQKLKLRMIRSVYTYAGQIRVRKQIRVTLKTPLHIIRTNALTVRAQGSCITHKENEP
jgi:hypothetical protein